MTTSFQYERKELLLSIEDVNVSFKQPDTNEYVPVLKNINGEVYNITRPGMNQGQIVALLGPSGIGKSTLFRVMAGIQKPNTGGVFVGPELRLVRPGDVGVVAQHYPLLDHRTVFGNLVFAGLRTGATRQESEAAAEGYLTDFGLTDHRNKYPIQLSGGQRQRVAIAQQLMCSLHYIVMDEPFSGLDVVALNKARKVILDVSQRHEENTIFVVTHDVTAAVSIADTIWLMGRDYEDGKPLPGARIMEVIDLIEEDVCWHADPLLTTRAAPLIQQIKQRFLTL